MAKYKNKIKGGQLTVTAKLAYGEKINVEELNFLSDRIFEGFLKVRLIRNRLIEYTGPIGISLYERLKKPVSQYDFFFIIEQMVIAFRNVERSILSSHKIVLDIHDLYINETTKEINFIYLPIESKQKCGDIIHFMETITYSVIPIQGENTDGFSRFVYFLKSMSEFDAEAIERYISREEKGVIEIIKGKIDVTADEEKTELFAGDDEATDILDDEETVLLDNESDIQCPFLYRTSTNEKIYIKKAVFRIGKDRNCVDYAILNNGLVSRKHIDIITRNRSYFVKDLGSKNKTRINDRVISEQCEIEIFNKDRIKLANEEFIFEY